MKVLRVQITVLVLRRGVARVRQLAFECELDVRHQVLEVPVDSVPGRAVAVRAGRVRGERGKRIYRPSRGERGPDERREGDESVFRTQQLRQEAEGASV